MNFGLVDDKLPLNQMDIRVINQNLRIIAKESENKQITQMQRHLLRSFYPNTNARPTPLTNADTNTNTNVNTNTIKGTWYS